MRTRLLKSIEASLLIASVLVFLKPTEATAQNQPSTAAPALMTPWSEPDLHPLQ